MEELRVFVVGTHRLFCEALGVILQSEGMQLIGTETDRQAALASIITGQPDVILVEEDEHAADFIADLTRLVQARSGIRFISLGFEDNEMIIHRRQQRTVTTARDLIEAITEP